MAGSSFTVLEGAGVAACGLVTLAVGSLVVTSPGFSLLGACAAVVGGLLAGLWRSQYRLRAEDAELAAIQTQRAEQEHIRAQVLDERARIAREIHDILAHTLGGLVVQLDAADALLSEGDDPEAGRRLVGGAPRLAVEGLEEARQAIAALRTDPVDLPEALAALTVGDGRRGQVSYEVRGTPRRLAPEASLAVYRTAQEALANARKHAPGAPVAVTLSFGEQADGERTAVLRVANGAPPDARRPHRAAAGGHRRRVWAERAHRARRAAGRYPARRAGQERLGRRADGARMSEDAADERGAGMTGSEENATVRVVVADDQRVVREGLVTSLSVLPGVKVVGAAADGEQAVALVARHRPQVVLMDLRMPRLDGVEATRRILADYPATAVVVLTTYADDDSILAALRAGALGYLTKDAGREQIARALHAAAGGQAILDPAIQARLVAAAGPALDAAPSRPLPDGLTAREAEVLSLIATGRTNAQIAAALVVSPSTVKTHINNIFAKTGVTDRAQAVHYAYSHGLASPG